MKNCLLGAGNGNLLELGSSGHFKTRIAVIRKTVFMGKSFIVQLIQYRGLKLVLRFSVPQTCVEKAMCELSPVVHKTPS